MYYELCTMYYVLCTMYYVLRLVPFSSELLTFPLASMPILHHYPRRFYARTAAVRSDLQQSSASDGNEPSSASHGRFQTGSSAEWSLASCKTWLHYRIIAPVLQENHIAFPDMLTTQGVRHRWILFTQAMPTVPAPHHTPLLRRGTTPELYYLRL